MSIKAGQQFSSRYIDVKRSFLKKSRKNVLSHHVLVDHKLKHCPYVRMSVILIQVICLFSRMSMEVNQKFTGDLVAVAVFYSYSLVK